MKINKSILIMLIFLSVVILPVSALDNNELIWNVTNGPVENPWLEAGSPETITVKVTINSALATFNTIAPVTFSTTGNLGNFVVTSVDDDVITAEFTSGLKSGFEPVLLTCSYNESGLSHDNEDFRSELAEEQKFLKIDHAEPYSITQTLYPGEATVHTDVNVSVRMEDKYGNPVDSKKETDTGIGVPERVEFICTISESCFLDGSSECIGQDVFHQVNLDGYAVAPFRLSHIAEENIIEIDPVPKRPSRQWITIYGIGEKYPWDINVIVIPSSREQEVGERFEIYYTLNDRYGNPSPNSPINISTDLPGDGQAAIKTNIDGIAKIYYGPKNTPGAVTITAKTLNISVFDESTVHFIADKSIHVTANPALMPSLDIAPGTRSEIVASLFGGGFLDEKPVRFMITDVTRTDGDSPVDTDSEPYLLVGSNKFTEGKWTSDVLTNNGKASVYFVPETLDSTPRDIGKCTIWAEYNNGTAVVSDTVVVEWRNDPYPSIETYIKPDREAYAPGQEIDVEIWVIGYGMPKTVEDTVPVDVMLCISRCEQMFENMGAEDKMVQTINVSQTFIDELTGVSGNRFGLVTCGETDRPELFYGLVGDDEDNTIPEGDTYAVEHYPKYDLSNSSGPGLPQAAHIYNDTDANGDANGWVTLDQPLQEGTIEIKESIENITPSAYVDPAKIKPDRYGIFRAINELVENPPSTETIKAVVLLTDDRKLTKYGEPDARGTWTGAVYDPSSGEPWVMSKYWSKPTNGLGVLPPNYDQRWTIIREISDNPDDPSPDDPQQNMAIFAALNDIRIYVISIPKKGQCDLDNDLERMYKSLAYTTGGEYYIACDYDQLAGAFQNISENLRVAAAANATMEVGFVEPDSEYALNYTAEEIFDYIPIPGPDYPGAANKSTQILHWDWEEGGAVKDFSDPENVILKNLNFSHEDEWEIDHRFTFNKTMLGTIQINESWMTNIRLKINSSIDEVLVFDLFNLSSVLRFENPSGEDILVNFPKVPIQINPGLIPEPMSDTFIDINNLTNTSLSLEEAVIEWDLTYIGTDANITEIVELLDIYGGWNTINITEVPNSTTHDSCVWIIVDQPFGFYTLRVTAISDDAGYDQDIIKIDTTVLDRPPYIKLE